MSLHRARPALLVFAALVTAALGSAQRWRLERVDEVGLKFSAPERLERLPMKLGPETLYQRARLLPKDRADMIRARFPWYCDVMEFRSAEKDAQEPEDDSGKSEEQKEMERQIREMLGHSANRHETFESWLEAKESSRVEIKQKGRLVKRKAPSLSYRHWKWRYKDASYGPVGVLYCEAAVYEMEGREVALVIQMPLEKGSAKKPKSKWNNIIKRMIKSGRVLAEDEEGDEEDSVRDKFADTPEKKEALEKARANTKNIPGWDYFTTPNYIVLYSMGLRETRASAVKSKKRREVLQRRASRRCASSTSRNYPNSTRPVRSCPCCPSPSSSMPRAWARRRAVRRRTSTKANAGTASTA